MDRRIIDMSESDLKALIAETVREEMDRSRPKEAETVRGIAGIAALYGCSRSTAQRIKKSGVIDDAIWQVGRTIVTDTRKALELKPNN